jgi:hypothetical protein
MEPMYYIGLDVHKQKISFCVKDVSGKLHAYLGGYGDNVNREFCCAH